MASKYYVTYGVFARGKFPTVKTEYFDELRDLIVFATYIKKSGRVSFVEPGRITNAGASAGDVQ